MRVAPSSRSQRVLPCSAPARGSVRRLAWAALGVGLLAGTACGALRQNLRSEFLSYRGAWFCESAGCSSAEVVQSKKGRTKGEIMINEVKLQPHTGLVFNPGTPVESMTASVRDCKGKSKDIPSDKVQAPGRHRIESEPESWVIWLDDELVADLEVGSGDCAVLTVKAHATFPKGTTYDAEGAVEIGG